MIANLIYWSIQRRWLFVSFFTGTVLLLLPTPEGLTLAGYRTLIIAVVAILLIAFEPVPLPAVALIIIVSEVYLGVGSADAVASAFMNDALFFIMGSLMLAVAIVGQGWDARIALGIIRLTGNRTSRIAIGFTVISAVLSSFIGEPTVAAMMLPIAMTLVQFTSADKSRVTNLSALLLFSIAYGSIVGSIGTPSGGGRNAIMLTYWQEFGHAPISYLKWMVSVYPLVLIQLPVVSWILWKSFSPEYTILDSGVRKLKVKVAKAGKMTSREILAFIVFLMTFLGWVFLSGKVGLGIIALTGVALFLLTDLVKWKDINRNTNWGVIILFGAAISLGTQLKVTGAALWLASQLLGILGDALLSLTFLTDTVVVLLTTALANMLSSSATVAVLAPITLNMPGDVIHLGLVTAISSAFGYFTVVAAPACMIVHASGLVKTTDFLKAGWKMGIASMVLLILYANTYLKLWI